LLIFESMNANTKYEIGQQVCFLYSKHKKHVSEIQIFTGIILGIHLFARQGEIKTKYLLAEYCYLDDDELIDDDELEDEDVKPFDGIILDEDLLFLNENDLMKFFKNNVRKALDKNTPHVNRRSERREFNDEGEDEDEEEEEVGYNERGDRVERLTHMIDLETAFRNHYERRGY
jgi:hypothetical protein